MKELILILMGGVLVNNYVLQRFLGICPFLGVSKKFNQASGMGIAVIFVMLCATAVTYPIQKLVLDEFGLGYLQTIVFILVIASLVQFVEIILKKFIPLIQQKAATTAQGSTRPTGPFVRNAPLRKSIPSQGMPLSFFSAHL